MGKKFKFAAMAVAVLSGSLFISCDDEEEFKPEHVNVTLPCQGERPGLGLSTSSRWYWTNSEEAAAELVGIDTFEVDSSYLIEPDSYTYEYEGDTSIDSINVAFDTNPVVGRHMWRHHLQSVDHVFRFMTKETGVRELKLKYVRLSNGLSSTGESYSVINVVQDTVIKF